MNVKNLSSLLLSLLTMVVLGCGGGGGGGEGTPVVPDAPPATLTVTSSSALPLINTSVTITANTLKADGTPVKIGTVVAFAATGGTLSAVTTTDSAGNATAALTSATKGVITVTATVGLLPVKTVQVTFEDPNSPYSVAVTGVSQANINTSVVLTATVTPAGTNGSGGPGGVIADGTIVAFTSAAGSFTASAPTTNGIATATLTRTTPQTVSISATVGSITSPEKNITFIDPTSPSIITLSDPSGTHLVNNPVTITANVVSISGGPVPAGTTVNFAVTSGTGTLSSTTATTNSSGNASVTLNSAIDGSVTITATTTSTTGTTTGSHSIVFIDPNDPKFIALIANPVSGVTGNLGPVTLTATLTPDDSNIGIIADGTPVTFTIVSGTGGVLSSTTATTTRGVASVTLNSNSTVDGSISVRATVTHSVDSTRIITSNTASVLFISQPTQVTVKVQTTGTLPAGTTIGGLTAIVTASPSAGLTIVADPNGNSSDVKATGAGIGSFLTTNSNNVAAVTLALVNTGGIQTGEFATLNYNVLAGSFPKASDFSIALNGSVIDRLNNIIPGIGVAILSVTIQ